MITITRVDPEVMLAHHLRAEAHVRAAAAPRPPTANLRAVRELHAPPAFEYRGRSYSTRPVSFEEGIDLLELAERLEETVRGGHPSWSDFRGLLRETADLCWRLLRPQYVPRWLWRLRRNPLRNASTDELRSALSFFGQPRTTSPDPLRAATRRP